MSSEKRIEASRANGAKSRGPVTPEGKQASSKNSLRHGILSKTIVLGDESAADFEALLAAYREEHQPETPTEETLVENLAIARWRQLRLWNMETAGLDNQIRHPRYFDGDDAPARAFIAFRTLTDETRSLDLLNRYAARCDRQFKEALTSLRTLRENRARAIARAEENEPPGSTQLYWTSDDEDDDSEPELVADSAEAIHPPKHLGSFGNSTARAQSTPATPHRPTSPPGYAILSVSPSAPRPDYDVIREDRKDDPREVP